MIVEMPGALWTVSLLMIMAVSICIGGRGRSLDHR
jgi:hypothetical protein